MTEHQQRAAHALQALEHHRGDSPERDIQVYLGQILFGVLAELNRLNHRLDLLPPPRSRLRFKRKDRRNG